MTFPKIIRHRLLEADSMRREHADNGEIECYTPKEFRALLETAEGPMRAMVAIGGLDVFPYQERQVRRRIEESKQ